MIALAKSKAARRHANALRADDLSAYARSALAALAHWLRAGPAAHDLARLDHHLLDDIGLQHPLNPYSSRFSAET